VQSGPVAKAIDSHATEESFGEQQLELHLAVTLPMFQKVILGTNERKQ